MRARVRQAIDGFDAKTRKAVIQAATDEFNQQKKDFLDMVFDIILWTLHEELGFGLIRLKRFYGKMFERCYVTREKYGLSGCAESKKPMSEKMLKVYKERAMTYPEYCKYRLKEIGWDSETVEEELAKEYQAKGGF